MTYHIQAPVSVIPEAAVTATAPRDGWSFAYRAAVMAKGLWTPIVFQSKADAHRLAEAASRLQSIRLEAQVRASTCFLRVIT